MSSSQALALATALIRPPASASLLPPLDGLHTSSPPPNPLILMNMTSSEQESAWAANGSPFSTLITPGVLEDQEDAYLSFATSQGWQLQKRRSLDGWLAFKFK